MSSVEARDHPLSATEPPHAREAKWQGWVLALVVLGCLATAGYAVVETFWG
jgi:hypothetical protein